MATPAHRLIQDQNSSFLYAGSNPGVKTDATRADKKRAFGARKALNDISNSRKPSVFQATTKEASKKGLYSEKDITVISKSKVPKASEKENTCGRRKALADLTNSAKPSLDRVSKVAGKLKVISEEKEKIPSCLADERFIHNHQECIKAQRKAVDADYFLESVGLKNGYCRQILSLSARKRGLCDSDSSSDNPERHKRIVQIEEIPETLLFDDHQSQTPLSEFSGPSSPICCSPRSPYLNCEDDVDLSDLLVIDFN